MTSSHSGTTSLSTVSKNGNQRDAWVEVDLNYLEKNVQTISLWLKEKAKQSDVRVPQIMAVIKASAYGHGAPTIASVLEACAINWLAVASADEGSQLRQSGCKLPILILSPTPSWAAAGALKQKLDLTISSFNQLQDLNTPLANHSGPAPIHLKVDTGMHRLGMNMADAEKSISLLKENRKFKLVSVFSHLAIANDEKTTKKQKECFDHFITLFRQANYQPDFYHLACSEAIQLFPFTYYDFVRIGLSLYGMEPNGASDNLLPLMSVRGRINQINSIDKGETVGYGLTWKAHKSTRLASLPIGYADGVDRRLSNNMQGLLHGKLINQVGTISMDQMLFDITEVAAAKEGDVITLIGRDGSGCLYLYDWANKLNTMVRELSCRLHMRLPYVYTRGPIPRQLEDNKVE